ncbi:MAG: hypothetical protein JXR77_19140 [Lentisphaeria bacterium]|nr:hypothetical protein [Lentisphaeria bacterium]
MGLSAAELNTAWERSRYVKLAPGLYAAKIQVPGHPPRITVNGFFPRLRERFVLPDARVLWYDVRFSPARLPWREFRRDAVGATNPAEAAPGSIREALFREPDRFGLPEKPTVQLNGVHASAGPLEGARERRIWLENRAGDSELVAALRQGEVPEGRIRELLDNGPMTWKGVTAPAFDLLEDVDAPVALERILEACRATA